MIMIMLLQRWTSEMKSPLVYNIGLYHLKLDVVVLNTIKNNIPDDCRVSPSTE